MQEISVVMVKERATKNKVLYKSSDDSPAIDNVYISKTAFGEQEPPENVTVTVVG
tara:strand:- start:138 stop:302 length:165 start_codon:yes stop_codon:yes gene_type:complete